MFQVIKIFRRTILVASSKLLQTTISVQACLQRYMRYQRLSLVVVLDWRGAQFIILFSPFSYPPRCVHIFPVFPAIFLNMLIFILSHCLYHSLPSTPLYWNIFSTILCQHRFLTPFPLHYTLPYYPPVSCFLTLYLPLSLYLYRPRSTTSPLPLLSLFHQIPPFVLSVVRYTPTHWEIKVQFCCNSITLCQILVDGCKSAP